MYHKKYYGVGRGYEYYRVHSDEHFDYWHPGIGWCKPVVSNKIRNYPEYVEISKLEILVALGAEAVKENAVL